MSSVIHISEAANLALHTMILLAAQPDRPLRVNQATEVLPISESHLAKVMQRLARAQLVESSRGPQGGFTLAKSPRQITLLEIFEAIEGSLETHACLLGRKTCLVGTCVLGDFATRSNSEFKQLLGRTRLSSVAGALKRSHGDE